MQLLTTPAPVLKELPGCGKRYIKKAKDPKTAECFWNCEVVLEFDFDKYIFVCNKLIFIFICKWSVENPKFDYEKPVFFLVEKKTDFLRNMFVDTHDKYGKDKYENRANIGFPGKY